MPSSISTRSDHRPRGSRFLPGPRPRCIAHRGLALEATENTLDAFAAAIAAGADLLETDTRATADGLALAVHDADLQRIAADPRRIDDLAAQEAGAITLHGGERLAMLEDVLGTFADVPVNIDIKAPSAIGPAVAAISRTRSADRVCIAAFDDVVGRRTAATLEAATGIRVQRSPGRRTIAAFLAARAVEAPQRVIRRLLAPYGALQVPLTYQGVPIITPANVAAAHRAGCEVHAWTVDDPQTMQDLLVMGVDGIITNRVDTLAAMLGKESESS